MKAVNLICIFLMFLLFSCGDKKESTKKAIPRAEIITPDQMKEVLVDVLLTEGAIGTAEMKHHDVKYQALHYYSFILKKHKMTFQQFNDNFNYYSSDIDQMEKIMTDVITELTEKEGMIRKKK